MGHREEWELYDAQGSRTGQKIKRGEPIPPGSYHRVVSVWLVNGKTEVLLSQRHPEKSYPLLWESTGGCVIAGETSLEGAVREVREELGICLEPQEGQRIASLRREETQDLYDVWLFRWDGQPGPLQSSEVVDAKWVTLPALLSCAREGKLHPLLNPEPLLQALKQPAAPKRGETGGKIEYRAGDQSLSAEEFLALACRVWPGDYDPLKTQSALKRTLNFTAYDRGRLVGCLRILTDGYFFGTITELLVLPEYQRRGIGSQLLQLAKAHTPTLLYFGAQPGREGFYEKNGCQKSMQSYQISPTD